MRVFVFFFFAEVSAATFDYYNTNDTYGIVATEKMFANVDRLKHSSVEEFERMSSSEDEFGRAYRRIDKFVMRVITINQRLSKRKDCPFQENREEKEIR